MQTRTDTAAGNGGRISHISRIDTFRAIAVSMVIVDHFFLPMFQDTLPQIRSGLVGVYFFFVISGFLITSGLFASHGSRSETLVVFYVKRIARIFPVYYVALIVGIYFGLPKLESGVPWNFLFLNNFHMVAANEPDGAGSHFWTLAVEEQFYLVWPVIIFVFGRAIVPYLVPLLIVSSILFRVWVYSTPYHLQLMLPFANMDALAIGAGAAFIVHHFGADFAASILKAFLPLGVLATANFLVPVTLPPLLNLAVTSAVPAFSSLFFAYLIVAAVRDGPAASSWGGSVLPWVGKISYGIYVYHLLIHFGFVVPHEGGVPSFWWRMGGTLLTVFVAWVSWRVIEAPAIALGARVVRAMRTKSEMQFAAHPAE